MMDEASRMRGNLAAVLKRGEEGDWWGRISGSPKEHKEHKEHKVRLPARLYPVRLPPRETRHGFVCVWLERLHP